MKLSIPTKDPSATILAPTIGASAKAVACSKRIAFMPCLFPDESQRCYWLNAKILQSPQQWLQHQVPLASIFAVYVWPYSRSELCPLNAVHSICGTQWWILLSLQWKYERPTEVSRYQRSSLSVFCRAHHSDPNSRANDCEAHPRYFPLRLTSLVLIIPWKPALSRVSLLCPE